MKGMSLAKSTGLNNKKTVYVKIKYYSSQWPVFYITED